MPGRLDYPMIRTPNGIRQIRMWANENDHKSSWAVDPTYSQNTSKHHKQFFIESVDTVFGTTDASSTTGPTPNTVRGWAGAVGNGFPRFVGYINGIYDYHAPGALPSTLPNSAYQKPADAPYSGNVLLDTGFSTYLFDPTNESWIAKKVAEAKAYLDLGTGWDFIFLDNIGWTAVSDHNEYALTDLVNPTSTTGRPWNPTTRAAYTKTEWMKATCYMAQRIRSKLFADGYTPCIFVNGFGQSARYYDATDPTSLLQKAGYGGALEIWLRSATASATTFLSEGTATSGWRGDLNAVLDLQNSGQFAVCMTKLFPGNVAGTQAQQDNWHRYALGSFLLVCDGLSAMLYATDPALDRSSTVHNAAENYRDGWDADVGVPIDNPINVPAGSRMTDVVTLKQAAGYYQRRFSNGVALVNPTAAGISVVLDRDYRVPLAIDGTTRVTALAPPSGGAGGGAWWQGALLASGSTLTLPAHDGAVLVT